jgi:hypothetical protein
LNCNSRALANAIQFTLSPFWKNTSLLYFGFFQNEIA